MGYIIKTYFGSSFKEMLTPSINNRSIQLNVAFNDDAKDNLEIHLEVLDDKWTITSCDCFQLYYNNVLTERMLLSDGGIYHLQNRTTLVVFTLIVEENYAGYSKFKKFIFPQNSVSIGSRTENNIIYANRKLVSSNHALIEKSNDGYLVKDLNSSNGTFINGKKIIGTSIIEYGDIIDIIGLRIICLNGIIAINEPKAELSIKGLEEYPSKTIIEKIPQSKEEEIYSRSPRRIEKLDNEVIEIESPPAPNKQRRQPLMYVIGPSITMIIPMSAGILFTTYSMSQQSGGSLNPMMFMGIITSITAAIIGAFWAITNFRYQKSIEREDAKNRDEKYRKYLIKMRKIIEEKHDANRTILEEMYPDINQLQDLVINRSRRIWERNVNHEDFLYIRLGIGEMTSPNRIDVPKERFSLIDDDLVEEPRRIREELKVIRNVPISISLSDHPLVGIIYEDEDEGISIARSMITQIVASNAYSDVKLVYFFDNLGNHNIDALKLLPHFWSQDEKIRYLGYDSNSVSDITYSLSSMIRERVELVGTEKKAKPLPHYVVFVTNPELLENETIGKYLLNPEELGISTILLYGAIDKLPNNCTVIIQKDKTYNGYYSLDSSFENFDRLSFDEIQTDKFKQICRTLSNIKIKEIQSTGGIPTILSFLDMYRTSSIESLEIYRRWMQNRTFESMKAMIGYRGTDLPIFLDIHEKFHGPHGLVAGTTGSGKSETLQTYILSLSINYHPHEISFIIIDYKGGGMANSFEKLPHLAGIITNLGGNQTNRALSSINSEIKRRQSTFSEFKVKHIDEYIELYRADRVKKPMPHLIIIADEFAELKKEQPDFVRALVSASRVGRSLGIHLILATQKPSGVVDDEIWGNSKFRICLRVQDKQDSMEMLKRSDAAFITQAGRGFFQVGNNEVFEEFQSGWSGAAYEPDKEYMDAKKDVLSMINLWGKPNVINAASRSKQKGSSKKQLNEIVDSIAALAVKKEIAPIDQIWLPPLPQVIYLDDIQGVATETEPAGNIKYEAILGIADDPVHQCKRNFNFDLIEEGNTIICGTALSGKSTLLQTMLYGLLTKYSAASINVYIADFGSRILKVFERLPQVGGVTFDDEIDKTGKLVSLLVKELAKRKKKFSEAGVGSFKEYSKRYSDIPAILFAIDNYSSFVENALGQDDNMILLSREGTSYGIFIVVTITNLNDMRNRIRQNFTFGIGLQLSDRYEYENVLNEKIEMVADDKIPGRGIARIGLPLEFQTAVCVRKDFSFINIELEDRFEKISQQWSGFCAPPIPMLPEDTSFDFFQKCNPNIMRNNRYLPIGYDIEEASVETLDLNNAFCISISGTSKSGKHNVLRMWKKTALQRGHQVVEFDRSEKANLHKEPNQDIKIISNEDELFDFISSQLIPIFKDRGEEKTKYINDPKHDPDTYFNSQQHIYFLIEDITYFLETVYNSKRDLKSFIEQMFSIGKDYLVFFVAIISNNDMSGEYNSKRALRTFIGYKEGIHLGGNTDQQRIFDFDVSIHERSKRLEIGLGHISKSGKTIKVLTPKV